MIAAGFLPGPSPGLLRNPTSPRKETGEVKTPSFPCILRRPVFHTARFFMINRPTPDGPQVFRFLSSRAGVRPRHLGAAACGVFGSGGGGVHYHRAVRLPRSAAGAGDIFRRAWLRRAVDPGWARRLCRDLAER